MLDTYVINLASSRERFKTVTQNLSDQGFGFERVDAIDGRGRSAIDFAEYDKKTARYRYGRDLLGGEVGCYLSHIKFLEKFVESGALSGLVVEDDCQFLTTGFQETLVKTIRWLDENDPDWIAVNLGGRATKHLANRATIDGLVLSRAYIFPIVTTGLLWSRAGALAVLGAHDRVADPVDHWFRDIVTKLGGGYAMRPTPIVQAKVPSNINDGVAFPSQAEQSKPARLWHKRGLYYHKFKYLLSDSIARIR